MEIPLSNLPEKSQSAVDRWNDNWRALQRELVQVAEMRASIVSDVESSPWGDLHAKSAALEGRVFGIHQKLVAALRQRSEILSECQTAQQAVVEDLEKALAKAEKSAVAALTKAGLGAEADPAYDVNQEAAEARLRRKVLECGPVRDCRNSRNDSENLLHRIGEVRREDRQILQAGLDELAAVGKRLLKL